MNFDDLVSMNANFPNFFFFFPELEALNAVVTSWGFFP